MNLKKVCFVGLCSLAFTSLADNVWNVGTYEKRRGWPIVSEDGTKKLYIKCAPQTDYTSGVFELSSLGEGVSGVLDLRGLKLKSAKGTVEAKAVSIGKDLLRKNASVTGFYANKVSSVGHCAFSRAEKLERVILSGSADTIPNGSYATHPGIRSGVFSDCPALKEVVLDLPLKHLGDAAFAGSTNLSSDITKIVPRTIESIGTTAFWNCINLRGELVTDAVKSVGSRAFQRAGFDSISLGCDGSLKEFASGGSSGGISYGVFTGGPNLTNLEVRAAGLVSLGSNNFSDIPNLKRAAFDAPKLEVSDMELTEGDSRGMVDVDIVDDDSFWGDVKVEFPQKPKNGSVAVAANKKTLIYRANEDFVGEDSFTVVVTDGFNRSEERTVKVNVLPLETSEDDSVHEGESSTDNLITEPQADNGIPAWLIALLAVLGLAIVAVAVAMIIKHKK